MEKDSNTLPGMVRRRAFQYRAPSCSYCATGQGPQQLRAGNTARLHSFWHPVPRREPGNESSRCPNRTRCGGSSTTGDHAKLATLCWTGSSRERINPPRSPSPLTSWLQDSPIINEAPTRASARGLRICRKWASRNRLHHKSGLFRATLRWSFVDLQFAAMS
jgi:hypothetical protein